MRSAITRFEACYRLSHQLHASAAAAHTPQVRILPFHNFLLDADVRNCVYEMLKSDGIAFAATLFF
jgi:hypothetical protein